MHVDASYVGCIIDTQLLAIHLKLINNKVIIIVGLSFNRIKSNFACEKMQNRVMINMQSHTFFFFHGFNTKLKVNN